MFCQSVHINRGNAAARRHTGSAVDMYALAKHSPLVLRRIFIQLGKTSCSNARAVLAAGSHHMPRWLWGLLRQARLPQFRQHSEFTSVLAARAQGQENAGYGYRAGKSDTPVFNDNEPTWII